MKKKTWKISKILVAIFTIMILCNLSMNKSVAITDEQAYAGSQLNILGILKGYPDGTLQLDNNIVRSEVAALTVRILGYEDIIILGKDKGFTDVEDSHWAYENIQNAYKLGVIVGYPDESFKPENNITYAEVVAIMVNALKENENLEGDWPYNYIDRAKILGVVPQDSEVDPDKIVTRGEMAVIIWDTLLVKE